MLQRVCHQNAERMLGLPFCSSVKGYEITGNLLSRALWARCLKPHETLYNPNQFVRNTQTKPPVV